MRGRTPISEMGGLRTFEADAGSVTSDVVARKALDFPVAGGAQRSFNVSGPPEDVVGDASEMRLKGNDPSRRVRTRSSPRVSR